MTEAESDDPFRWLEEVEGERALAWVRAETARSVAALEADPRHAGLAAAALAIVRDKDRLDFGRLADGWVFDFLQDDVIERGLWRRATFASWRAGAPEWTTILDIDALARAEGRAWVFQGAIALDPQRIDGPALVRLSDGGGDTAEGREFDRGAGRFVSGGFAVPPAKFRAAWHDADTLLLATDWGPGTLTESGYPFVVKSWRRGEALAAAREIFRGAPGDVSATPFRFDDGRRRFAFIHRSVGFFASELHWLDGDAVRRLALPPRFEIADMHAGELAFALRDDWTVGGRTFRAGAIVSAALETLAGPAPEVREIWTPGPRETLGAAAATSAGLVVTAERNVRGFAFLARFDGASWTRHPIDLPTHGTIGIASAGSRAPEAVLSFADMTTPPRLYLVDTGAAAPPAPALLKSLAPKFAADDLATEQFEAASRDGTRVPYFLVHRRGAPGPLPTLLYGYGGFEIPMLPDYRAQRGRLWLERGGAFALANIRGGGEFGPAWHQAALKGKRQVAFDDFIAVAEDLIGRGATAPRRLGIMGGSNGGLLMGAMMTQRPELFAAAVIQVPLLDMLRYHLLLAGASWIDEYGDPRKPEERAFLAAISPYHRLALRPDMPVPFFVTSTRDDRVHPGHARKFAAKMQALGLPFLYYEKIEGGHGAAATLVEMGRQNALIFTFLSQRLMDP